MEGANACIANAANLAGKPCGRNPGNQAGKTKKTGMVFLLDRHNEPT
jgi:hypothetical protein